FFLLLGYPVAFSLAANGLIFGLAGIWLNLFTPDFLQALPERVYGVMSNDTLLAIPFFTFMGLILERSGMAEDLLDTIGQLFSDASSYPDFVPGLPKEAVGFREDTGARGLTSLAVLAALSAAVGIFAMHNSETRGADYVVLTMFIGIMFAFAVSVANWFSARF